MYANSIHTEVAKSTASSAGGKKIKFAHPFLKGQLSEDENTIADVTSNCKLNDEFFAADLLIPASTAVPTLDGGAAFVTNVCQAGTMSINAIIKENFVFSEDLIAIAQFIRVNNDTVGGAVIKEKFYNGILFRRVYYSVFFTNVPLDRENGVNVPTYPLTCFFGGYQEGTFVNQNSMIKLRALGNQKDSIGNYVPYNSSNLAELGFTVSDMYHPNNNPGWVQ